MVADHQRAGVDQVEPGADAAFGQMQPSGRGQLGVREDLAQPLDLGGIVAGDQDLFTGGGTLQLGLDLGQLAREPLDALDPHVAGRLERIGRQRRDRDRGQADQPLEACFDAKEPAAVFEPVEVMPPLLAKIGRLDQCDPGAFRKVIDRVTETREVRLVEADGRRQRHRSPAVERALGFDVEGADRLDLVTEELDAHRVGRVGGKDVEDSASHAEFSGHFDDFRPRHAALEHPGRQALRPATTWPTATVRAILASSSGLGTGWSVA